MNSIFKILFTVGLSFTLNHSAYAAVEDGTQIPNHFINPLMQWVQSATGTSVPALPKVVASGHKLKQTMGLQGAQQARAMAAYIPGQVVLNNIIWDTESVRSVSYLVHELVHHAQLFSKKKYACNNAKEYEAYTLQNKWLEEQGERPIVSAAFIEEMAACPNRDL